MLKIIGRDEQKQDLRQKMLKIVGRDEQKQDLRRKMLKIVSTDEQSSTTVMRYFDYICIHESIGYRRNDPPCGVWPQGR